MGAPLALVGIPAAIAALFLVLGALAALGARALARRKDRSGAAGAWLAGGSAAALAGLFAFVAIFQAVTR